MFQLVPLDYPDDDSRIQDKPLRVLAPRLELFLYGVTERTIRVGALFIELLAQTKVFCTKESEEIDHSHHKETGLVLSRDQMEGASHKHNP